MSQSNISDDNEYELIQSVHEHKDWVSTNVFLKRKEEKGSADNKHE